MNPLLQVDELTVNLHTYLGTVQAVRGVSFTLQAGEMMALVGESGCGKSITAQAIMGLLPFPYGKVEKGSILFGGQDLLHLKNKERGKIRGREIAMIFQDPMTSLNPTMRIGKQIMEGVLAHYRISKQEAKKQVLELLEVVGISNPTVRFTQYPYELSGGMRQRVMIAIALACNPKLLIADEPTTALDVTVQAQILELLKKIQASKKTSILLITHDLAVVAETCDRVLVMYGGKIVERGSVGSVLQNPQHPYTKSLILSIPHLHLDPTQEISFIPGSPPNLLLPPSGCPFHTRCPHAMQICKRKEPPACRQTSEHAFACWLPKKEELRDKKHEVGV